MTNCLSLRFPQSGKHDVQNTHRTRGKRSSHSQNTVNNHWLVFSSLRRKNKIYKSLKAPRKKRRVGGGEEEREKQIRRLFDRCNFADYALPPTDVYVFHPLACHPSRPSCVVARFYTIPPGGTLFHSRPDVKWVAAGSMGAQGASAVGCGAPWESSAAFSTGVAWVDEDEERGGTGTGGVDDSLSPPHPPPLRHTGANVKRFRDVKADTRVAHLGPTTSQSGNARHTRTHVWS